MNLDQLRAETPGAETAIYLNNAGVSLMPQPVIDAVQGYFALEAKIGGYPAMMQEQAAREAVYASVARLINARPSEIALMGSHTLAWTSMFYGMSFAEGDRILTSRSEYAANYIAFLQMRKRTGCEIKVIPSDNRGATNPAALEQMIDGKVKLIAVNWIPTNGGLVNPAAEIGRVANKHGIPYLLDACQAVGQMPVDVHEIGCDYLSSAGRKWLRGPKGSGFLYVREERLGDIEPAVIDDVGAAWTSPDSYALRGDARRFETHEHEPALRLGLGAAAEYALSLGVENICRQVRALAEDVRQELEKLPGIVVRDLGSERGGLVTFSHESVAAADITSALQEKGIWVKTIPRAGALMDTTARDIEELVRISPHYFNTDRELETCLAAIREVTGR
jgi:cysteine desulfurase/selenocysteine lyase